jgi:hypothetical protein
LLEALLIADLRNELNTHLTPLEFSWAWLPLLQAFPSASTLGEVVLYLPSLAGLFIYRSRGKFPFRALQWNPPHNSCYYKLYCSKVAGRGPPLLPSQAGLFIHSSVRDCPSPTLQSSGRPAPFCYMSFCCCCCLFSFFLFFPWVGVSLSRGLCWSGPGLFVGVSHAT